MSTLRAHETFRWTDERVEQLRDLFAEGLSANWIAAKMGAPSRNAVVGKLHRLGLRRNDKPEVHVQRIRDGLYTRPPALPPRPAKRATPFRKPPELKLPKIAPAPISEPAGAHSCGLFDLHNTSCRWPLGDGPPFLFCAEPTADFPEQPYCPYHARRAHRRPGEQEAA